MSELNYSSFEQAVYPYCGDISRIEEYARRKVGLLDSMTKDFFDTYILLAAGLSDDEVERLLEGGNRKSGGVTPDMLSRYRKGSKTNKGIWNAYLRKDAISRTQEHFSKYLLKAIIRDGEKAILYDLWQIILHDDTIPRVYREDFEYWYSTDTLAQFLANVYVFAITRDMSVDIKALEEAEERTPKLNPNAARAVRDVQIRGDTTLLISEVERITALLDEMKASASSPSFNEKQYMEVKYEGAMLWRQTVEYVNADRLDEAVRERYERLESASYALETEEMRYEDKLDAQRRIARLNDRY